MIRKLTITVICVALMFSLAACAGGQAAAPFGTEHPWGAATYAYERCEYSVKVFERVKIDGKWTDGDLLTTEESYFCQTLNASGAGKNAVAVVDSELAMEWADNKAAGENAGKSDRLSGTVTFSTVAMAPITSEKSAEYDTRNSADGKAYNNSYRLWADYDKLTSRIEFPKKTDATKDYPKEKDISMKPGAKFDNEQLFYLLRTYKNLIPGSSVSFNINSVVENYVRNSGSPVPVTGAAYDLAIPYRPVGGSFFKDYAPFLKEEKEQKEENDDGKPGDYKVSGDSYSVRSMAVILRLSVAEPGPAHILYMTAPDVKLKSGEDGAFTAKLIVGYEYTVYDLSKGATGDELFRYEYTLRDYSTKRGA